MRAFRVLILDSLTGDGKPVCNFCDAFGLGDGNWDGIFLVISPRFFPIFTSFSEYPVLYAGAIFTAICHTTTLMTTVRP